MMRRQQGFTLVEIVLSITVFAVLIAVVFTTYNRMLNIKVNVEARQTLIDRSYFLMEKLQVMMADYTIDYEEYYDRSIVGCDSDGAWGTGGHNGYCDNFTYYGNGYSNQDSQPIYCSSVGASTGTISMTDCLGSRSAEPQGYLSYAATFVDMHNDVDTVSGVIGDEDDEDLGIGAVAVAGPVSELYLISYDGTKRLFLRRSLVDEMDWNNDGAIVSSEQLYSIQQLQLQGVDAGYDHTFAGGGAFDGVIDTWRCDAEIGYDYCSGGYPTSSNEIANTYRSAGYQFPAQNDPRIDLFGSDITVSDWEIMIAPDADYALAWADDVKQISPFVTINLTAKLYAENWAHRIGDVQVENFSLPLQTTFAMKQFYR